MVVFSTCLASAEQGQLILTLNKSPLFKADRDLQLPGITITNQNVVPNLQSASQKNHYFKTYHSLHKRWS